MPVWLRYLLFQVPGWLLAAAVCAVLWRVDVLPSWAAAALLGAWMAKDLALYPMVRRAYEPAAPTGAARLVGARAVARRPLDPVGYVEVEGQLWRAEVRPGEPPVEAGATVVVRGGEGLTLEVSPVRAHEG